MKIIFQLHLATPSPPPGHILLSSQKLPTKLLSAASRTPREGLLGASGCRHLLPRGSSVHLCLCRPLLDFGACLCKHTH